MSGPWPPEWEDSDTGLPEDWDLDDVGHPHTGAPEVTSFLASVPSPALPAAFEARISAAIAAEAAGRADGTGWAGPPIATAGADDAKTSDRSSPNEELPPAVTDSGTATAAKRGRRRTSSASRRRASRSGPAGSRPGGRPRRFRMSAAVTGPLLVVLVIVGFAVVFTQFGSSPSYSGVASGGTAAGTSSAAGAAPAAGHSAVESGPGSYNRTAQGTFGHNANFVVSQSGTAYEPSTLASQVRSELAVYGAETPAAVVPVPSMVASGEMASASASAAANTPPPAQLRACVARVTGGVSPIFVDQASYDGSPAYIIAVSGRVWVVRPGCTAADPQKITSVSLAGLSGNLSALGSVEWYASPEERRMQ